MNNSDHDMFDYEEYKNDYEEFKEPVHEEVESCCFC